MAFTMQMDLPNLPQCYNLTAPVGPKMVNRRDDVLLVQTLMQCINFIVRKELHPRPVSELSSSMKVDGIFGPQTQRYIKAFEKFWQWRGFLLVADGVFESTSKSGYTHSGVLHKIVLLNQAAKNEPTMDYERLPFDSRYHPILRASLLNGANPPGPSKGGLF